MAVTFLIGFATFQCIQTRLTTVRGTALRSIGLAPLRRSHTRFRRFI